MTATPLETALTLGQSIWYGAASRSDLGPRKLAAMVEDGLRGVVSTMASFAEALAGGVAYDEELTHLVLSGVREPEAVCEQLVTTDTRAAADELRRVFDSSQRRDGHVALEISPAVDGDAEAIYFEGNRRFREVGRENLLISVPATPAGFSAGSRLVSDGVGVDFSPVFGEQAYCQAWSAYVCGLERRAAAGQGLRVESTATLPLLAIDEAVDEVLRSSCERTSDRARRNSLASLRGRAAVATAQLVFLAYERFGQSERWRHLAARGARAQRPLWSCSTPTGPSHQTTRYAAALVAAGTVSSVAGATYRDFRRREAVEPMQLVAPWEVAAALEREGMAPSRLSALLLEQGLARRASTYAHLLALARRKRQGICGEPRDRPPRS